MGVRSRLEHDHEFENGEEDVMAVALASERSGGLEIAEPPRGLAILSMIGPGIVWAGLAIGGANLF